MILRRLTVEGYRSVRERLELVLDARVTVLLGANDHGKSNVISAVRHLNPETPFTSDDVNWDVSATVQDPDQHYPVATYTFSLTPDEILDLQRLENLQRRLRRAAIMVGDREVELRERDEDSKNARAALVASQQEHDKLAASIAAPSSAPSDDADSASSETAPEPPFPEATASDVGTAAINLEAAAKNLSQAQAEASRQAMARDRAAAGVATARRHLAVIELQLAGLPDPETARGMLAEARSHESELARQVTDAAAEVTASQEAFEGAVLRSRNRSNLRRVAQAAQRNAATLTRRLGQARSEVRRLQSLVEASEEYAASGGQESEEADYLRADDLAIEAVPTQVVFVRTGVNTDLTRVPLEAVSGEAETSFIGMHVPRVELIPPPNTLPDSVSREALASDDYEFMRGIFYYAGLDRREWPSVFEQSDPTRMRLDRASEALNKELQRSWTQGAGLQFLLRHGSDSEQIELMIKDPSVHNRYVRASRRSSGFTHFFALKTVLNARQAERPASSYIWLFDEPGIQLHPDGQSDLVRVLETLGHSNQVFYATHSIFMINKNHPSRHRLIVKTESGTRVDQKPFIGRWKAALEALGLSMPGTLLFASKVLITEGDTDPVLLGAILQKLNELSVVDVDINPAAMLGAGTERDAEALVRILRASTHKPMLAALCDSDEGGERRATALRRLLPPDVPVQTLPEAGTDIEDYVIMPRELLLLAAATHTAGIPGVELGAADIHEQLTKAYDDHFPRTGGTTGLGAWLPGELQRIAGLDSPPSKTGVAYQYASLLAESDVDPANIARRTLRLVEQLQALMKLEPERLTQSLILEEPVQT